jgi:hypothetical protein
MDPTIIAAFVTGALGAVASMYGAIHTGRVQMWLAERQRRSEAKLVLDRYRGPLRSAAWELGHRIDNIRTRGLAKYLEEENPRRITAIRTTAFRFAQYFGWTEILRVETQLLRFDSDADTRAIADLLGSITWIFASDSAGLGVGTSESTDQADVLPATATNSGGVLMLWLEEQREIGELMRSAVNRTILGRAAIPLSSETTTKR